VTGNLEDEAFVLQLVSKVRPEVIFHLASHVSGSRDLSLVPETFRANLLTTVNLLLAVAGERGPRLVLAGSMEEPSNEGPDLIPASPYAASKWAASGYARMFAGLYDTPVTIARIFMVYGPGQVDFQKLVPYVIRSLLLGKTPELSSGVRHIDWVFVDDVVDALCLLGNPVRDGLLEVEIGSGEMVPVRAVVETVERILGAEGRSRFGAIEDRPREVVRSADVSRTESLIGWRAATPLRDGLQRTVEWVRDYLGSEAG
jgi:nucleoside-diphosphate-sugar epimerase